MDSESRKLPEKIDSWLFPPDNTTRDFANPTNLLGIHDDFITFDKFGKVSSRDEHSSSSSRRSSPPPATRRIPVSGIQGQKRASTLFNQSPLEFLVTSIEKKSETPKHERRRNIIVGGVPIRTSWPDKVSLLMAKRRIQTHDPQKQTQRTIYVDAGIQTQSPDDEEGCSHRPRPFAGTQYLPRASLPVASPYETVRHPIYISSMQSLYREQQYGLGDALYRV